MDAWKTYRHHISTRHRHHDIELMDFVSILVKDLFENSLTRRTNLPPRAFNLALTGYEIELPDESNQDPEVPEFERLTQDSVFALPGEDPELDDALQEAMPARSVEAGTHGLKKVDEYVTEMHQYNDAQGNELTRQIRRRKRGRCIFCDAKTSFYCPTCSAKRPRSGRYWCCGPDAPNGRICQSKHDSEWVFENVLPDL